MMEKIQTSVFLALIITTAIITIDVGVRTFFNRKFLGLHTSYFMDVIKYLLFALCASVIFYSIVGWE